MNAVKARALRLPVLTVPQNLIDEFGDVTALRRAFAPTELLYQKLREQLKDHTAGVPADAAFTLTGDRFTLAVSARAFESKPDIPAVRKRLGAALFLTVATVTKKALEAVLVKRAIDALCISTQTGSRSFDPTPR